MSKQWIRGGLAAVVIGAAMFATVGEGPTEKSSSDGDSGTPAATSSQSSPIALGTETEVAKGWTVKVNSAELNANATVASANEFNKPEEGKQYVIVNVTVSNKSDQPEAPFTNVKLSLLPPSGVAVDTAFVAGVPNEIDSTAQMQPGASATGSLVFEVPSADVDNTVMLGQSVFTLDAKKDQKFFAIK